MVKVFYPIQGYIFFQRQKNKWQKDLLALIILQKYKANSLVEVGDWSVNVIKRIRGCWQDEEIGREEGALSWLERDTQQSLPWFVAECRWKVPCPLHCHISPAMHVLGWTHLWMGSVVLCCHRWGCCIQWVAIMVVLALICWSFMHSMLMQNWPFVVWYSCVLVMGQMDWYYKVLKAGIGHLCSWQLLGIDQCNENPLVGIGITVSWQLGCKSEFNQHHMPNWFVIISI